MYYPCREKKGADQLRGYSEADLRLCFHICKKPIVSRRGSFYISLAGQLRDNTVKFLNFRMSENFAVIYLIFRKRGQTLGYSKISNKRTCSNKRPPPYLDSKNDHFFRHFSAKYQPLINAHWKTMGQKILPAGLCLQIHCSISKRTCLFLFS